nr:hypothetical protein [Tanacetum cinerariifolium]
MFVGGGEFSAEVVVVSDNKDNNQHDVPLGSKRWYEARMVLVGSRSEGKVGYGETWFEGGIGEFSFNSSLQGVGDNDPRDMKIASLKQRIQELQFPQLEQDSPAEEAKTESNETESEPIIWDIRDDEYEYPFVNKYPSFQEEPIMLVEEESCPVYDTDNEEEESMLVYDTEIKDMDAGCSNTKHPQSDMWFSYEAPLRPTPLLEYPT